MSERFTAVIKIIKVQDARPLPRGDRGIQEKSVDTELASIVVRASTLSRLVEATKGHLDLVVDAEGLE